MLRTTSLFGFSALAISAVSALALGACSSSAAPGVGTTDGRGGSTLADGGRLGCSTDAECTGGVCKDGACFPSTASDGKKNAGETGVDCGGPSAPPCADGQSCVTGTDCKSVVCTGGVCQAPTSTDGVKNGDESDVDCGGASTGAPRCADGKTCAAAADCTSGVCGTDGTCKAPASDDGVKNGDETDVDCGGGAAPACAAGKACVAGSDCDSRFCTAGICEPRMAGRKDGDETDVDCGGKVSPPCAWQQTCLVDGDCASSFCSGGTCEAPSCKAGNGGQTCGTGEVGSGNEGHDVAGAIMAGHESCCRSIEVPGYSDAHQPGKKVYLDKYEITAGRMREFLVRVAAAMGGEPNVKAWMAAHRPSRWVTGWEDILPTSNAGELFQYTVARPTVNRLYFGEDVFGPMSTQGTTWWVVQTTGNYSVDFQINTGVYTVLGGSHLFPEFKSDPADWYGYTDYSASHNLNCFNGTGSYGYSTYWFDKNTVTQYSGGTTGKKFSQAEMDVKTLNCTPTGLFAAFCAWDGGQIATTEVFDTVTNNGARLLVNGHTPTCADNHNVSSDGTGSCPNVYFYPDDQGNTYDGSSRIAPPGRVAADALTMPGASDNWHDLRGNVSEMLLKADNEFQWNGYGIGYGSAVHHKAQGLTPRFKEGSMGARCMRFR